MLCVLTEHGISLDRCLLLDECSSALDPAHQYSLMAQVSRIAKEGVAVMHDMGLVDSFGSAIGQL